jgi:hypothetical protein
LAHCAGVAPAGLVAVVFRVVGARIPHARAYAWLCAELDRRCRHRTQAVPCSLGNRRGLESPHSLKKVRTRDHRTKTGASSLSTCAPVSTPSPSASPGSRTSCAKACRFPRPLRQPVNAQMSVGGVEETITVTAKARSSTCSALRQARRSRRK